VGPAAEAAAHARLAALHGAYHVLNRRMTLELRDHGLSPSEAVVLEALRRYPRATIAIVRQLTGLRASTLDSMLDRLVARELLMRESPRDLRGEVVLATVGSARLMTTYATTALRTIDEELRVYVAADVITGLETVFEGARALGVPGTAADL
jgi:DNA-binding MarR family transcriptional regulator